MLVRMLFRLGWIVQVTLALALLSLSLWIQQQAIAGYTALPWLALIAAALLVAGKALAIAYYPYAVRSGAVGSYRAGPVKLLQLALAALSLVCALSFFANQIERGGFGTLWLLQQVGRFAKQPAYGALTFWCARFLSLLLELALGFLHGIVPGRESLVLDLIEPLRPGVDALVLRLLDQVVTPAHFTRHPAQGCRLDKEGRGLFYPAWANARQYWPLPLAPAAELGDWTVVSAEAQVDQSLRIQCRRMIRLLRSLLQAPAEAGGGEEGETDG